MSETTVVETPAIFRVKIENVSDFRQVAPVFNVAVSDGPGAMPKRQLLVAVRDAVKAGKAELIETPYFGVDAVLNPSNATGTKGKLGGWKISYKTVDSETGKVGSTVLSIDVDKDKIKALMPDAALTGAKLNGVIALVMVAHFEGASIAELPNYVVTDIVRMDAVSDAASTDDAPKGDDTGETDTDADKAPETVEDVKPVEPAPVVEAVTPELVPADTAKPAKTPAKRTRKPAAK